MTYKNQTYYWVLPLNEGKWTLARHVEGTWHLIDGRSRLTNDLGQTGEEILGNNELVDQRRMHDKMAEAIKNAQIFFESCQENTKKNKPTWISSDTFIKGFPEVLELLKQAEKK